jgi:hypothetical protein
VVPALIVLGLMAVSAWLRTRALGASLWMDEGLSIGIASQPFFDIPGILRQDGSPPLYYLALNVWMDLVGAGPRDTQALSLAIALLGIPGGLWAGWSLFGQRAGYICAALVALNPFLTNYAQETRMYSLMVVLSLLITTALLHIFVFRRRKYLPLFGGLLALIMYTHNWGLFVASGCVIGVLTCLYLAPADERRGILRDGLLGFGGAALVYVPWLPTLLYQTAHTGAPWLNAPRFGAPVQISKSLLGGGTVTTALVLVGGAGLASILLAHAQDQVERRERTAVIAALAVGVGTLFVAWSFSQVSPAWTTRYLGVALGPIFILGAAGLARARTQGLVALALIVSIWIIPHPVGLENKSNASDLGVAVSAPGVLERGDLVVVMQPEQTPLIDYHLPPGLRYATPLGGVDDPLLMDWRDAQDRLEDATAGQNLEPLLATLPPAGRVLLVTPVTSDNRDWDAPWTQLVRRRGAQWSEALATDPCFRKVEAVPAEYRRARRIGVRGVIYEKSRGCPT